MDIVIFWVKVFYEVSGGDLVLLVWIVFVVGYWKILSNCIKIILDSISRFGKGR